MSVDTLSIKRFGNLKTISEYVIYNRIVSISGQVAADPVPESVYEQSREILEIIDHYLISAGSDRSKILTLSITLVDMGSYADADRAVEEWLWKESIPARHTTVQSLLARADWKVEIAATAAC